jgi:A/G-specific adenine glycosylase
MDDIFRMILVPTTSTITLPKEGNFETKEVEYVRSHLLSWYYQHRRRLPWRGDSLPFTTVQDVIQSTEESLLAKDKTTTAATTTSNNNVTTPYSTWVSEIMCQQTRVETVIKYHTRWMEKFPTIQCLASASEKEVNKQWSGLGYYRRARYLHQGAQYVVQHYNGKLPTDVQTLQKIPGIGPYTAGAIASISFHRNSPIVDGNIVRVMSRLRALGGRQKNRKLVKACWILSNDLIQHQKNQFHPGDFNQSIMELGATICSPKQPKCRLCPIQDICRAYSEVKQQQQQQESKNKGRASIVIDYSEDDDERKQSYILATSVTKYPFPKKKIKINIEVWCINLIEWRRRNNTNNGNASYDSLFLLLKRPSTGLLANQWEFPSIQSPSSSSSSSSLSKPMIDASINDNTKNNFENNFENIDNLHKHILNIIPTCQIMKSSEFIGNLKHTFSHIKHHMKVYYTIINNEEQPSVLHDDHIWISHRVLKDSCKGTLRLQGHNSSSSSSSHINIETIALTTGMRKVFDMFVKREYPRKSKKRTSTQLQNGIKTISSYFTKKNKN